MSAPKKEAFEEYIATLMDRTVDLVFGLPLNAKEEGLAAILSQIILFRLHGEESIRRKDLEEIFSTIGIQIQNVVANGKPES